MIEEPTPVNQLPNYKTGLMTTFTRVSFSVSFPLPGGNAGGLGQDG